MSQIEIEKIASLDCISVKNDLSETAVILLHGYGANMRDLFPLWEMWHQSGFDWYFPNAPLSLPMGFYEGRAWFSIDIEELERAMREGTSRDLSRKIPPEFSQTMNRLKAFMKELEGRYKRIILGGFSQGAMSAVHLSLDHELKVDALVLLSGSLLASDLFPQSARALPFIQSHGISDPILSVEGAKNLFQKITSLGMKGKFIEFQGVHEIPVKVIEEVKEFLSQFAH